MAVSFGRRWTSKPSLALQGNGAAPYPSTVLDLIIFHKLHICLPAENALKSYRHLRSSFVDWNEVRISTVREIQEALSAPAGSLDIAVFIKDLLEFVHRERQDLNLEFLVEQTSTDIRRFLKQVRGLDTSTIEMVLRQRKEYPVFPLNPALVTVLNRLGVLRNSETILQQEKALHELVDPRRALLLHHFLLDHSRRVCPPDVASVDCPSCRIRQICAFYARGARTRRSRHGQKNSPRTASRDRRAPAGADRRGRAAKPTPRGRIRKAVH
ncbi:MAG: hypothetical protein HY721_32235 [Planctomycetes bacterium]|nr:hypothetical protein [Planctomycetota bacterium]